MWMWKKMKPLNPVKVQEVMSGLNERSTTGRVVVNPPSKMAPLDLHNTGEQLYFCYFCGRTTEVKRKHIEHVKQHGDVKLETTYPTKTKPSSRLESKGMNRRLSTFTGGQLDMVASDDEDEPLINLQRKRQQQNLEMENEPRCRICDIDFPRMSDLRIHLAKHLEDETTMQCEFCDLIVYRNKLRKHKINNHNPADPHLCPQCNTRKPTAQAIQQHILSYHNEPPCEPHPTSQQPTGTRKPERKSTASRSPKPKSNRFNKASSPPLRSSLRKISKTPQTKTPTGEITVIDLVDDSDVEGRGNSGRAVVQDPDLNIVYRCKVCQKTFLSLTSLRNHFKEHSTELCCELCSAKYKSIHALQQHHEKAHKNGSFKCDQCPCKFKSLHGIQTHVVKRHGGRARVKKH